MNIHISRYEISPLPGPASALPYTLSVVTIGSFVGAVEIDGGLNVLYQHPAVDPFGSPPPPPPPPPVKVAVARDDAILPDDSLASDVPFASAVVGGVLYHCWPMKIVP